MKSRRRISRKFVITSGVFTVFILWYLHFGLLPGTSKQYAIEKIETLVNKKIEFSKILYWPFEGLSLHDVKVMDKKGAVLFSAKKLAVNVRWLPFLRDKKILVSNFYLDTPVIELQTEPHRPAVVKTPVKTQISGQIEVPVVSDQKKIDLETLEEGPDALLPENVYVEQIQILNGVLTLRKNAESPVLEEIHSINVRMGFQKPPLLSFDGSVRLGRSPYATVALKGSWDLKKATYEFYLDTQSDFIPPWLIDYQKNHFLILKNSRFKLDTHLRSFNDAQTLFHSKASLDGAEIAVGKTLYEGEMAIDVQGVFDLEAKRFDRYLGTLELKNVNVRHLTGTVDSLEKLNGHVRFQPDLLEFVNVRGAYRNIPFQTDGALRSFKELNLDETIRVDSDIRDVLALVPENQKSLIGEFSFDGRCQAVTTVKGPLRVPGGLRMEYKLHVENGTVRNPAKKINATQVSADIFMDPSELRIQNARFNYENKRYSLNAFIPKKPEVPGLVRLGSDDLQLSAGYLLNNGSLAVRDAHLETRGITADFQGRAQDLQDPFCDIAGRLEIRLDKIADSFAKEAPFFKAAGLGGALRGTFALKGPWNRPADWTLNAEAAGPLVLLDKKFRLTGFEIQALMKDRVLRIPLLRALAYRGHVSGTMSFDLLPSGTQFDGKFYANEIDLHALVNDLDASKKDIAGKVVFQTSLNGTLGAQESYRGSGLINIHDGRLFKTDLFRQMGHLPFVKVEGLEQVEFTSLNGHFTIQDRKARTDDLRLLSETVDLSLEGSIGFDQSLDMTMDIHYSDSVMSGAYDTGGIVPFVVQQAENSISQYKVSGSLKEPKYDKIGNLPVNMVNRSISGILKTVTQ